MTDEKMLDKIRKLLAMAEGEGLTPEAREVYNAKARQLIAQYGIDEAMASAKNADTPPAAGDKTIDVHAPYALDKITLLASIANPLGCRVVQLSTPNRGRQAHLFGMAHDLARVDLLYTSLLVQMMLEMSAAQVPARQDARAWRRSWIGGYAVAIHRRLQDAENTARLHAESRTRDAGSTGPTSVALVLVDQAAAVDRAIRATYPKTASARGRRLSGSGGNDGYAAGQRADLHGNRRAVR